MSVRASGQGIVSLFSAPLRRVLVCAIAAAISSVASASTPAQPTAESVKALIRQAENTRTLSAERGMEWLRTSDLIDEARAAAEAGDLGEAARLATEAMTLGELAIEQADREARAWKERVPR